MDLVIAALERSENEPISEPLARALFAASDGLVSFLSARPKADVDRVFGVLVDWLSEPSRLNAICNAPYFQRFLLDYICAQQAIDVDDVSVRLLSGLARHSIDHGIAELWLRRTVPAPSFTPSKVALLTALVRALDRGEDAGAMDESGFTSLYHFFDFGGNRSGLQFTPVRKPIGSKGYSLFVYLRPSVGLVASSSRSEVDSTPAAATSQPQQQQQVSIRGPFICTSPMPISSDATGCSDGTWSCHLCSYFRC
jgi:hypothetical protein